MKVREATLLDVPWLLELAQRYSEEVGDYGGIRYDADKGAQAAMWAINDPSGAILLVHDGRAFCGLLWAYCGPCFPWSSDIAAQDFILYVAPEYRGSFAAPLMIRRYKQWAVEKGARVVSLSIASGIETDRAMRLFRRLGFDPVAQQARFINGNVP